MALEYSDQHQRMITDEEWRVILRSRQRETQTIVWNVPTGKIGVVTATEIVRARLATATAEFVLPVDTAG